jgi:hypothetical protein
MFPNSTLSPHKYLPVFSGDFCRGLGLDQNLSQGLGLVLSPVITDNIKYDTF